jgi:hypothetical protein
MTNSTHTTAYTTIGTSVVKNCTIEGELVGAVGLVFRRGETEVELSLAEPTLGSVLAFYRSCQRGNLLAPEGIVAQWDTNPSFASGRDRVTHEVSPQVIYKLLKHCITHDVNPSTIDGHFWCLNMTSEQRAFVFDFQVLHADSKRWLGLVIVESWDGSETRIRGKDLLNSSHSLASATPFSDIIGGRFRLVTATSDQSRLVEMSDEDHITWVHSVVELRSIMSGANLFGGRNN